MNNWLIPDGIEAVDGFTIIDTTVAGVTMKTVEALTAPNVAVIEDVPTDKAVPRPVELTVATASMAELQVTDAVKFCWVPSVKVPVAVNCCVVPSAIDGMAGVIVIDVRAALPTVRMADPDTLPNDAEIVDCPEATLVASPIVPLALLTVATELFDVVHCAEPLTSCVVPSVNVPIASN